MSGANYAHCDVEPCLQPSTKVFYIGDEDLPFGTVVRHGECDDSQLAAAEQRGYDKAVANLRERVEWLRLAPDFSSLTIDAYTAAADYLIAVRDQP